MRISLGLRLATLVGAILVLAAAAPVAQRPGSLTVAAASDLQTALPAIGSSFERKTGIKPTVTFGSSGNFFAQIQNGAPFDIFFSADADYPRQLATAGLVDPASVYTYAIGRLVLWTRTDSGVDISAGLTSLGDARARRIAIANPAIAPYGRAAAAALRSQQLYERIERKLVFAENVSQAAQLAESGNADVAIIGHALALDRRLQAAGHFVAIPSSTHPPIVQAVAIVAASRHKANAQALLDFVKSAEARAALTAFGFEIPETGRR